MALQTSGAISLLDVQTEFGGDAPISMSEYYGVDTLPTSGAISLADFYGTSAIIPEIENMTYLAYNSSRSYTGTNYPVTRYGRGLFVVSPDGTQVVYVYMDYDYHYFHHVNLSTPWNFSTMQAVNASQYMNPSNHYQNTLSATEDGTKYIFGGYTNALGSGWGHHYIASQSPWSVGSSSLATYSSPRYQWAANEGMNLLVVNSAGTKYIMGHCVNSSNSVNGYGTYLREYNTSNFSLDYNSNTQVGYLDLGALLGHSPLNASTGYALGAHCMNRSGTQIIVSSQYFSGGARQWWRFYAVQLASPFTLAGATVNTNQYLDMHSVANQYTNQIQHVQYGKDEQELIFLMGSGSYGSANGVKGYWLAYEKYTPVWSTILNGTTGNGAWSFDDQYPENTGTTYSYGYKESTGLRIYAPYWGSGAFYAYNQNLTGKTQIRLVGRWSGCAYYCNAGISFPSTNGTTNYQIRVTGSASDGTFDVTIPIVGSVGTLGFGAGNTGGGSVYLDKIEVFG